MAQTDARREGQTEEPWLAIPARTTLVFAVGRHHGGVLVEGYRLGILMIAALKSLSWKLRTTHHVRQSRAEDARNVLGHTLADEVRADHQLQAGEFAQGAVPTCEDVSVGVGVALTHQGLWSLALQVPLQVCSCIRAFGRGRRLVHT